MTNQVDPGSSVPMGVSIFLLVLAFAQPASSCLCALGCLPVGSCAVSESSFEHSEMVFLGEVVRHEPFDISRAVIRVRVVEWFKGGGEESVVELKTPGDQAACGVDASVGLAVFYVPSNRNVRLCTTFRIDLDVVDPRPELRLLGLHHSEVGVAGSAHDGLLDPL